MRKPFALFFPFLLMLLLFGSLPAQEIISLRWDDVVGISRQRNLDLQIARQDYRNQKLNQWKVYSDFLPTVNYQFQRINNIELPEFVFMGNHIRVGTNFNFSHSFQLQYPLFLGGARWANLRMQSSLKKSLKAQLAGKEDEVVLNALQSYFQIMLSDALLKVNNRSHQAAKANLDQVEKFYRAGTASRLDYLRARSHYSSTLAPLVSARNARRLAAQNLKFILNLPAADSLIVPDSLKQMDFLKNYAGADLASLQELALRNRPELRMMEQQKRVAGSQKLLAASAFLPSVVFSAAVQHQAQLNSPNVNWDDYTRVKNAAIVVQFPLFQGGKRAINYQQARIAAKQADLRLQQTKQGILMDVESSLNKFREAKTNLASLQEAMREARETLRLANLNYREGMATQVDVLNAQLAYAGSDAKYRQGIFDYNMSQLRLLKSIGRLKSIWEEKEN